MLHTPTDDPRFSMDLAHHNTIEHHQTTPQSATSSNAASSPSLSTFSRGHHQSRSGGSGSSLASSPVTRDSFDVFGPSKRLEDVTEEPQEREDTWDRMSTGSVNQEDDKLPPRLSFDPSIRGSPPDSDYSFGENEIWSTNPAISQENKRQRSAEYPSHKTSSKLFGHFPSLSKRWKHKSGVSPQLSIITHTDRAISRTSSANSSHLISPALSAISKHESHLPPSPITTTFEDRVSDSPAPIAIEKPSQEQEEPTVQATTPLLPPIFTEMARKSNPIQSPLQSPTIAATPVFSQSTTPNGTPQMHSLPSPPLSSKPSVASMKQRSRANTSTVPTAQIPALHMLDQQTDEWATKLGHADFSIYPEPYTPEVIDTSSYSELCTNRDMARSNYEKHRAQTGENYGVTSKVYQLTQGKWNQVDAAWEKEVLHMKAGLGPALAVVEAPSGKFPELGEEGIIGSMTVVPARVPSLVPTRAPSTKKPPPDVGIQRQQSQRKRTLFKFFSDFFARSDTPRSSQP